jgi:crotonobetainyl-CoA:carnitine CoA-transferase CaiB-like acyl-CoA transferase
VLISKVNKSKAIFNINIDQVYGYLSEVLATRSTTEWLLVLEQADIPAARMYSIEDILDDEHVKATDFVQTMQHPTEGELRFTRVPTEWSESKPENQRPAPELGQHTVEILVDMGYSASEIKALQSRGVLGAKINCDEN